MEVGDGVSGVGDELVLESAPEMAKEVTEERFMAAGAGEDVVDSENVAATAHVVGGALGRNQDVYPSVEELIAKARAPVKREYVRLNVAPRVMAKSIVMAEKAANTDEGTATAEEGGSAVVAKASVDRKSKRQLKRERKQARSNKSAENLCGAVAKTGDTKSCQYGTSCRFNHDLAAFLAQKPPDLEGYCPFQDSGASCPYGYACRYAGSHPKVDQAAPLILLKEENKNEKNPLSSNKELNNLDKTFQKVLWKNLVTFPKADAQLGALGLLGKAKKMKQLPKEQVEGIVKDVPVEHSIANQELKPEYMDVVMDSITESENLGNLESKDMETEVANEPEDKKQDGTNGVLPSSLNGQDEVYPPHKKVRTTIEVETTEPHVGPKDELLYDTVSIGHGDTTNGVHMEDGDLKYVNDETRTQLREKKLIDFRNKLYLAPLTTAGNLPFRRVCKRLGADITCGEMAMCTNLLQGQASEWALLRRHEEEDVFGVQICGSYADTVARAAELIERECKIDFIDLNLGCPIDLVVNKGGGSSLLCKPTRLKEIVIATAATVDTPLTLKLRMGFFEGRNCAHTLIPEIGKWGAAAVTIHGRTRQQRYSKVADWEYINQCITQAPDNIQLIGNGDVFSYTEYNEHLQTGGSKLSTCMIARGAMIKPWLFTEIKEQRHWDITAEERLNILRDYVKFGLTHWGSDTKGVETTRHFLLEWLSYAHRYIPVGLLEVIPQRLNWRPPNYFGRNDLETLMASDSAADWVRLTELVLGPPPATFVFSPKHKSNAYDKSENG